MGQILSWIRGPRDGPALQDVAVEEQVCENVSVCAYVFAPEPVPWLCVEQQVQKCPRVPCFVDVHLLRVRFKKGAARPAEDL